MKLFGGIHSLCVSLFLKFGVATVAMHFADPLLYHLQLSKKI
jgi:hypothetical protein